MKKFTKLFAVALCLLLSANLSAEKIMLDLSTPANPEAWTWTDKNYWDKTYVAPDYTYFESQIFMFSHIIDGNSYGGFYYDGFTVSKNASDADMTEAEGGWIANQWGCMAKGGISTFNEGMPVVSTEAPYLIAYYSSWAMAGESLDVMFNDGNTYNVVGAYVTNSPYAYWSNINGVSPARALDQDGDFFTLTAHGVLGTEEKTVSIKLAENTGGELKQLTNWTWFDLSSLGEVEEIYFTLSSSDNGGGSMNTPAYFCMDRLTVEEVLPTAADEAAEVKAYRISNTIYGIAEGAEVYVYNLGGQLIINQTVNGGSITLPNAAPYYITKIVTEGGVQTVR